MMQHQWPRVLWAGVMVVIVALAPAASGATVEQVEKSIVAARNYLYSQQKNGNWEVAATPAYAADNKHAGGQWGGLTAITTYALLASGESYQDPRLAKAIAFLKAADIRGTYAIAMRCQVWLLLPQSPEVKAAMARDAKLLLAFTKSEGSAVGLHDYTASGPAGSYSLSRSQYASLGLWAAAQSGVEIPDAYWRAAEQAWMGYQHPSGAWTYKAPKETENPLTPGMTAAAIATLYITQDMLHASEGVQCKGNITNPAIERGVKWLAAQFDKVAASKRYERDFPFATLYSVERVGVAGGLKYIGEHDWYAKGADWLVKVQRKDGAWASSGQGTDALFAPIPDTCFGLLFLIRGRAPVVMSKLQYAGNWNERPRDLANLVQWMTRQTERHLNWQIVNLQAPVHELHDAPILYITGNQALEFSDADQAKLREYIESGGMVLGQADCGSKAFGDSFRKLAGKLFPGSDPRELPEGHSVFAQQYSRKGWKNVPKVIGWSNGIRELMLLVPEDDLARAWQTQAAMGKPELHQIASNIFLYATDRHGLRYKGQTHIVMPDAKIKPVRTVKVARLKYAGQWDPEPGGWRRLAAIMHNRDKVNLDVEAVELGTGKLTKDFAIAHLTGLAKLSLTAAQKEELKRYVAGGGLVVMDAAGGSPDFAMSAESELAALLPDAKPSALPASHPLFAAGASSVTYRQYARRAIGNKSEPQLTGFSDGTRLLAVLSPFDLSAGLVGQSIDGISGYSPESATAVMRSIILHANPSLAAPPAKPAPAKAKPKKP